MSPHCLGVILLAAGESRRMGQPKLLLPWKDSSILGHVWNLLGALNPAQSILVLAPGHPLSAELDRLKIPSASRVLNPDPSQGMFASIKTAISWPGWNQSISHFLIALGDQPLISSEDLSELLLASQKFPGAIFQPEHDGKRGHPILLPRSISESFLEKEYFSLKEALADCQPMLKFTKSNGPGTLQDIDTPDDYRNLSPGNSAELNA